MKLFVYNRLRRWAFPIRALMTAFLLFFFCNTLHAQSAQALKQPIHIIIPYLTADPINPDFYYQALLKLAFEKTASSEGEVILDPYPVINDRERQRVILKAGTGLDVIWCSTSESREEQLLAIKFNLLKEINDYKILLIRSADQHRFLHVKNVADLRAFTAGTGTHWRDTDILDFNNLPYIKSVKYQPIFKMLSAKRVDYVMRGSQEIWTEIDTHTGLNLTDEKTLLLYYAQPVYFFVNKEKTALADRILRGLQQAQQDGSFDKLFNNTPGYLRAQQEIHNPNRKIIEVMNVK